MRSRHSLGKSHEQQAARRFFVDAAGAQVEERVFLDLADGGAVRAFHVVGVNFELRLGVDLRAVGKQQVAIGLLGVGLLRVLVHDDAAMENAVRAAVQNAVVELAAAAVRAGVLDQHVVIEVLLSAADEQAVDQAFAAFAGENRMNVVAHDRAAQQHGVRRDVRASSLLDAQRGDIERARCLRARSCSARHVLLSPATSSVTVLQSAAPPPSDT